MKRNLFVAAAIALAAGGASAQYGVTYSLDMQLGYTITDLAPDDGEPPVITLLRGCGAVDNAYPTFLGDHFDSLFAVSPHTQMTFDGYIKGDMETIYASSGANIFSQIRGDWKGPGGGSAIVGTQVGPIARTLSDHDFFPIHWVLTNDTGHDAYGHILVGSSISFNAYGNPAYGVPEAPTAAMLGLGLLGLAAIGRRASRRAATP